MRIYWTGVALLSVLAGAVQWYVVAHEVGRIFTMAIKFPDSPPAVTYGRWTLTIFVAISGAATATGLLAHIRFKSHDARYWISLGGVLMLLAGVLVLLGFAMSPWLDVVLRSPALSR